MVISKTRKDSVKSCEKQEMRKSFDDLIETTSGPSHSQNGQNEAAAHVTILTFVLFVYALDVMCSSISIFRNY